VSSEDIVRYSNEFSEELKNVFNEIKVNYKRENLISYFNEKNEALTKLIESMSVLLISNILSSTSIIKELNYDSQVNYKVLDENINRINYEIDRLSAELSI
jgi:hypothetical protein